MVSIRFIHIPLSSQTFVIYLRYSFTEKKEGRGNIFRAINHMLFGLLRLDIRRADHYLIVFSQAFCSPLNNPIIIAL